MLDRIHGKIVFACDGCGDDLETDMSDFGDALGELRGAGWRARKVGDVWCHYCGGCHDAD